MRAATALVALVAAAAAFAPPARHLALRRPGAAAAPVRAAGSPRPASPRGRVVLRVGEESGLPDPAIAVAVFAFLFAAFAYTQFDMVQVVNQEDLDGAEGSRRARDALARKRGYFRK